MVTALTFSILGSSKRDVKTLLAAILYICSGNFVNYVQRLSCDEIKVEFIYIYDVLGPFVCFFGSLSTLR